MRLRRPGLKHPEKAEASITHPPTMRRLLPVLLVAVILLAGCVSHSPGLPNRGESETKARIECLLRDVFEAAERKDLDRLDGYHLFGSKFTKFGPTGFARFDAAGTRAEEHAGLSAIQELSMHAEDLKIDVFGEAAIATFILKSTFRAGDKVAESRSRATLVLVKDAGEWKITHEHFSVPRPSP